jgi:hypothetical protein
LFSKIPLSETQEIKGSRKQYFLAIYEVTIFDVETLFSVILGRWGRDLLKYSE